MSYLHFLVFPVWACQWLHPRDMVWGRLWLDKALRMVGGQGRAVVGEAGWANISLGLLRGLELPGVSRSVSPFASRARQSSRTQQVEGRAGGLGSRK